MCKYRKTNQKVRFYIKCGDFLWQRKKYVYFCCPEILNFSGPIAQPVRASDS